jgi:hypothetical protein
MIHFDRPPDAPIVLTTLGVNRTASACREYDLHSNDYETGLLKFDISGDIYGHASVKASLIDAQHDKCFACESKVTHIAYGDVEHYRPKGGYRQSVNDPLEKPGYYWLAYSWTNLFFSCQLCNQRFKRNLFPLRDPAMRMRSHHDQANIALEEPVFIDPSDENPEEYISFRREIPYPIDGNVRGEQTIKALGLEREELNEERRITYSRLRALYRIGYVLPASPFTQEARDELAEALEDSARYTNMARAAMAANFSINP